MSIKLVCNDCRSEITVASMKYINMVPTLAVEPCKCQVESKRFCNPSEGCEEMRNAVDKLKKISELFTNFKTKGR